jgi:hypothetical protein
VIALQKQELVAYWLDTAEKDLLLLAEKAGIDTTRRQKDLLDLITTFNISARYPDYKRSFYLKCTPEYTAERLREIEELRAWLMSRPKA